ncbi:hypothetical protein HY487_01030 [Candidatus Woesearchaeota archaeon]|nr:hypothetical protein [Candidatus Woesearchaeota archaeon]
MKVKSRLPQRTLLAVGNDEASRDELLVETFSRDGKGLTLDRLLSIRRVRGSLYGKLTAAANSFYGSLLEAGDIPTQDIAYQFTASNLAALVNENWNDVKGKMEKVSKAIAKKTKARLKKAKAAYNFASLSPLQLFRENVRWENSWLYRGNLYEARDSWKKFQPSEDDFLRNIKIPTSLGFYEAFLLGVTWAYGAIHLSKSQNALLILGDRRDLKFYEYVVVPLIRDTYNLVTSSYKRIVKTQRGQDEYEYAAVEINSQAICTWLANDLGFAVVGQKKDRNIKIPFGHLTAGETRYGFFAGALASMGEVSRMGRLRIGSVNKNLVEDVASLAEGIGYRPSEVTSKGGKWFIYFPRRDLMRMCNVDPDEIANMGSFTPRPGYEHVGLFFNMRRLNWLRLDYFKSA